MIGVSTAQRWDAAVHNGGKLLIGNWKMNGVRAMLPTVTAIARLAERHPMTGVGLALPATLIASAHALAPRLAIGSQDVHAESCGAHTGGISAEMVADAGAAFVILNHSEVQDQSSRSQEIVQAKIQRAGESFLDVILCCGDSVEEYQARRSEAVVVERLRHMLGRASPNINVHVAYEPIWAIGGRGPPPVTLLASVTHAIKKSLIDDLGRTHCAILYGGSVSPLNALQISSLPHIDGLLVGGASLTSSSMSQLLQGLACASAEAWRG